MKKGDLLGIGIVEKKCSHCGKVFCPTPQHVYKRHTCKKTYWFCKWSCMLRYEEAHPDGRIHNRKKQKGVG